MTDKYPVTYTENKIYKILFTSDFNVCAINSDGTDFKILHTGSTNIFQYNISPDGSSIVFIDKIDGERGIFMMDFEGNIQTEFIYPDMNYDSPIFSPDGKYILFLSRIDWINHIYLISIDNGKFSQLTYDFNAYNPTYSNFGDKIAFDFNNGGQDRGIVLMESDGNNPILLGPGHNPQFSASDSEIMFSDFIPPDEMGLYTMDISGDNIKYLTNIPFSTYPKYSPEGLHIVFSKYEENFEIYLMNVDGSNKINLTKSEKAEYEPSFSSDGKKIVSTAFDKESKEHHLCIMNIDGSDKNIIIQGTEHLAMPLLQP